MFVAFAAVLNARASSAAVFTLATITSAPPPGPLRATRLASASAVSSAASSTSPTTQTVDSGVIPSFFARLGGGAKIAFTHFSAVLASSFSVTALLPSLNRNAPPSARSCRSSEKGSLRRISPRRINSGGSISAFTRAISPFHSHMQVASRPIFAQPQLNQVSRSRRLRSRHQHDRRQPQQQNRLLNNHAPIMQLVEMRDGRVVRVARINAAAGSDSIAFHRGNNAKLRV